MNLRVILHNVILERNWYYCNVFCESLEVDGLSVRRSLNCLERGTFDSFNLSPEAQWKYGCVDRMR